MASFYLMVSCPPIKMVVVGGHFSGPVGVYLFLWPVGGLLHMGRVIMRDFLGGTPVPISYPTGQCRTQVCKSELTNYHREVCRIKFYQTATSDVLISLWQCDKILFDNLGHVFLSIEYIIGASKEVRCFLKGWNLMSIMILLA